MEYKKIYSSEELADIINWTKQNMHRLPKTLQLDKACYIPDLPKTMSIYVEICEKHYANETYGAQIRHIFQMREKLLNDNLLLPEDGQAE